MRKVSGSRGKARYSAPVTILEDKDVNLLCSEEQLRAWLEAKGIKDHKFLGDLDDDCKECGLSIYMPCHHSSGFDAKNLTQVTQVDSNE